LARRVLSRAPGQTLLLVLALASCRREEHAPAPSASVSAAGSKFSARAREQHFQEELARATTRWKAKPSLGDCSAALKEKPDLELCQAAESALAGVTSAADATPEASLSQLAPAALALARLSERLRYLSLQQLAELHVERDAAPAPSASAATAGSVARAHGHQHGSPAEQRAMELREGPIQRQLEVVMRLERDVLRNLGAYLEYAPLPTRQAAFATAKALRVQHPRWPALAHLLNEAAVLETDANLKRDLQQLSESGSRPADQSAATK